MNGCSSKPGTLLSMPGRRGRTPHRTEGHSRSYPARHDVAQSVGLDVLRALKGDVLLKHICVIVLSGLGQANESKLLKEGAAAFVLKSEKSFENNSSLLISAVESVLTQSNSRVAPAVY